MNTTSTPNQIVFHTNGLMDPLSWEIIGMSAKETDSAIGQFGSGLKFAIAILMRTGHEVEIFVREDGQAEKHYVFGTVEKQFRGKDFRIVTCNGKELGITTAMGAHWEMWMAYRELVSNTLDEGGIHYAGDAMDSGTSIIVKGDEFASLLSRHNEFFVGDRDVKHEISNLNIYQGNGTLFYRGVKVGNVENAMFSYEMLNKIHLTEDRTIYDASKPKWEVLEAICNACTDRELIKKFATAKKETWEGSLGYNWSWSDTFESVVSEIWMTSPTTLNPNIAKMLKKRQPDKTFTYLEFDEEQQAMMDAARKFLSAAEYPLLGNYHLISNEDINNIAFVMGQEVYLTPRCFAKGLFYLVQVLFEESAHVQGFHDETRSFESYLIEQIIIQAKKRLKYVL